MLIERRLEETIMELRRLAHRISTDGYRTERADRCDCGPAGEMLSKAEDHLEKAMTLISQAEEALTTKLADLEAKAEGNR